MYTDNDWTNVSFDHARNTLKKWRECGVRRSEEAVEMWEHVISRSPKSLGDELWAVLEQICIAAYDCTRFDIALKCKKELEDKFPNSERVMKLEGLRLEANDQLSEAMQLYDYLLSQEETNNSVRKRRIAVLLAQGERLEAIKALNDYLKIYLNDTEAWIQLSQLFLLENDLSKAAHCLEECVLISPLNSMYLRRLGDIRYSQGGMENIDLARAYYERALKVNPNDLRSQYGLSLACSHLAKNAKNTNDKKKAVNTGIDSFNKLIEVYSESDNPEAKSIIKCLDGMKAAVGTK